MGVQGLPGPAGKNGKDGAEGPQGERGPMGLQGPPGKDAPAGASYRPLFWVGCTRILDLISSNGPGTDGLQETFLGYSWTLFSDGDVDVSCEAGLGSAESAASGRYYPAVTNGASNGGCTASVDYPPLGMNVGGWNFKTVKTGPSATYTDLDSGHWLNNYVVTFAENDCNVQRLDESGKWQDAALSDAF
jgi:hypothetical protein